MGLTVDYYFAPQSPWTYLGHQRFAEIVKAAKANVRVLPVDLGGKVFPVTGGLPLAKRAPQRQAYRLVELQRFSEFLGQPINLRPERARGDPGCARVAGAAARRLAHAGRARALRGRLAAGDRCGCVRRTELRDRR